MLRRTFIALTFILFASVTSAGTGSARAQTKRGHAAACEQKSVAPAGSKHCRPAFSRALVIGTGVRAAWGPFGLEHRAITVSVTASGDYPHRIVCSVACTDGAEGTFSAHYRPGIFAGFIDPGRDGLDISGRVDCLNVVASSAIAGGVIEQSNVAAAIGRTFFITITDRGLPGKGRDLLFSGVTPGTCLLRGRSSFLGPIDRGPAVEDGDFTVAY